MKKIVLLTLTVCAVNLAIGSHLRCGYISAQPSDCSSRTYDITITVYTNSDSQVPFGGDGILNFGDGTNLTVPEVAATYRPDLGPNVGMAQFTVTHTFPNLGSFLISYLEPNRNGGVLNMDDSYLTTFYTETSILISPEFGCTESPEFLTPVVLQAAAGTEFTYSMGVFSGEDNLITYELVTPFSDKGTPVNGYIKPGNLAINYLSGLLTWDTKFSGSTYQPGEYNFAIQVNQHIKTGETYTKIGFIRIDFQVIVNGDVDEPVSVQDNQELDEYSRLLVPEGDEKKIKVYFESTETSTLEAFSELVGVEALSFETYDSTHDESTFKVGVLTVKPDASVIREHPYLITVRAKSGSLGSDINYLVYTDEILPLPVIETITAIEKEITQVEVFPNPVQNQINIQVNKEGISEVRIYSTQGTLIKAKSFEGNTTLTLSEISSGVYICDLRRNNTSVRRVKLIKTE